MSATIQIFRYFCSTYRASHWGKIHYIPFSGSSFHTPHTLGIVILWKFSCSILKFPCVVFEITLIAIPSVCSFLNYIYGIFSVSITFIIWFSSPPFSFLHLSPIPSSLPLILPSCPILISCPLLP